MEESTPEPDDITGMPYPERQGDKGTARTLGGTVKAPSTPRFREGRLWVPSGAASGGAMSANWTG